MKRLVIVGVLIVLAIFLSRCDNVTECFNRFFNFSQTFVTPSPSPSPRFSPTPWPTPIDVPMYVWFNYKRQKYNQEEYTFYYSYNEGKSKDSGLLAKCKLNKELVAALFEKDAIQEIKVYSSKCRALNP